MAAFSPFHLVMADGWSATRAPACFTSSGNFCLKYSSGPSGQPMAAGSGLKMLGRSPVAWSSETVTLGTPGLAASTVPP